MWLFPQPTEVAFKTSRSKNEVIKSLEQIVSFKGDRFKFPVRIFGHKLFIRRKFVVGNGVITEDGHHTHVSVTLQPSGQIRFAFIFTLVLSFIMLLIGISFTFSNEFDFLAFVGLITMSIFFLVPPRIMYLFAFQMKKDSFENLVLYGD